MITFWRVLKIFVYMVACLVRYAAAIFAPRATREALIERMYVDWAAYVLRVFRVNLRVEGIEHARRADASDETVPRVLLSNHQSQLDIPSLVSALGERVGFVAKKELGRIPLLAFWMRRIGCVFIDRSDTHGARKALEAKAREFGDQPLAVFPEGTRSKTGKLLPVKSGGLRMALQARARIVPAHLKNTRAAFEAREPGIAAVDARLRFFPPVDARDLPDDKTSIARVKAYLEACWKAGEEDGEDPKFG